MLIFDSGCIFFNEDQALNDEIFPLITENVKRLKNPKFLKLLEKFNLISSHFHEQNKSLDENVCITP